MNLSFKPNQWVDRECSAKGIVERICDGSDYERGELESLQAGANKTSEFLGALTQLLVKKKIISVEEFCKLTGAILIEDER